MRTLANELVQKGLAVKEKLPKRTPKKKNNEQLSNKEWHEIMGCNRDTYSRGKGGAIRRR
ncbi:hypothetical protein ACFPYN_02960 [Paenisporosarcina macmurdoensis]|uniref:Uncharacterized protein n=1 Tax=Paenisporosarcina macmurdoensis TaxID=212659 RepID=A0ABW1L697_9BACL